MKEKLPVANRRGGLHTVRFLSGAGTTCTTPSAAAKKVNF